LAERNLIVSFLFSFRIEVALVEQRLSELCDQDFETGAISAHCRQRDDQGVALVLNLRLFPEASINSLS
jgi:hypothetical protein